MIKVIDIGYQFINIGGFEVKRPQGSGDYLFILFRSTTEVCLNGETYQKVSADTYIIFSKGTPQLYRKWDGHFINDWMHFDFDVYNNYFEQLGIPLNTPITLTNHSEISEILSSLDIDYFSADTNRERLLSMKADRLFHKFSELYHFSQKHSDKMNNYRSEFTALRCKIQNRQYCPNNVDEIADSFHLSLSYFQHLYKQFFGNSVYHDIIKARMDQAAHLLANTDYAIGDIAQLCGYDNFEHFSRLFKKHKGASPRNYRKQTRNPIT